jgi:hypothetical protein
MSSTQQPQALKGDRAEGPADQTRQKTHAMVKAGGALPPALPIGRGQGRTATCSWSCGLLIATAATTLLVATQHNTAQLHKRSELEGKGSTNSRAKKSSRKGRRAAGQEKKTLTRSHRNCYLVNTHGCRCQIQGVVLSC